MQTESSAAAAAAAAVGAALTIDGLDLKMNTAAASWLLELLDHCPCWDEEGGGLEGPFSMLHRHLADADDELPPELWEKVVVSLVLVVMLVFMMFDKVGPDWVMLTALVIFMVCEIVTIKEGLEGFANEGIMTVMALFVVAEGVSRTGALDYYMGLVLGSPTSTAGAQIRLMVPIAILSAFLNNTPIVVVMIPLVLRWAKRIGVPKQQLLMPLSYATILGGTCTLVGTSTNLVVSGLHWTL
jgi:di/tricarboxylate transporter